MMDTLLTVIKKKRIVPIKSLRQYIWQDECNDQFLLTRTMEIFLFNESCLGLYIFSPKVLVRMRKLGLNFDEIDLDEQFTECKSKIENLPYFLSIRPFKIRPNIRGNWILRMEKLLAHKILLFHIKKDIKGTVPIQLIEGLKKYREKQQKIEA